MLPVVSKVSICFGSGDTISFICSDCKTSTSGSDIKEGIIEFNFSVCSLELRFKKESGT